jgi:glycosyltransferase involved in cell wall biosynthesis
MQRGLAFFPTRWGTHHGGINTFNLELCRALASAKVPVACFVTQASSREIADALPVQLFSLDMRLPEPDSAMAHKAVALAANRFRAEWWIGHDTTSGAIALEAARLSSKRAAIIHHMHPLSYKLLEGYTAEQLDAKDAEQRRVLQTADAVFAVGPVLYDTATDQLRGTQITPIEIIPGLTEVAAIPSPQKFSALIAGRLKGPAAYTKQLELAVQAFATAAQDPEGPLGRQPQLLILGGQGDDDVEQRIAALIEKYAGRRLDVLTLPFNTNRSEYLRAVSAQSAVMMPSWHEGFGLVAWEAISAAVPVIVSKASGVAVLLEREVPEEYRESAKGITVLGNQDPQVVRDEDVQRLAMGLQEIACNGDHVRQQAVRLRDELRAREFTWTKAANAILAATLGAAKIKQQAGPQAAVLGVSNFDVVGRVAVVCLVVNDLEGLRVSLSQVITEVSRLPEVSKEDGQGLESEGFSGSAAAIPERLVNYLATAPFKTYAITAQRQTSDASPTQQQTLLMRILQKRFQKRGQRIETVLASRQHLADARTATARAWLELDRAKAPPAVQLDVVGPAALVEVANWLAGLIAAAYSGQASLLQRLRRRFIHIFDEETRKN